MSVYIKISFTQQENHSQLLCGLHFIIIIIIIIFPYYLSSTTIVLRWFTSQKTLEITKIVRKHSIDQTGVLCVVLHVGDLVLGAFSIYKRFRKISIGNSGNFRLGRERSICHKSHSFTSPSPLLHQNTRCLGKLFCYFLEGVFVRRFPVKQILIIGMCGYKKSDICMFPLFQVYSGRNFICERKSFSELFMQHFTRETCTAKESFEQERISTYHFYIRHIRAAINFHDLALERGRQSTHSSPEVCLQKASRNLTRNSRHFLEARGSPGKPGRFKDRKRHGTGDKDEKFCKWNTNFHWDVPAGKTGLPS